MFESFRRGTSERLDRPKYHEDFQRFYESGIRSLNKLERGQNFKERGFPSWEAFAAGDVEASGVRVDEGGGGLDGRNVPEVVILGNAVMYEVIYDSDGNAAGANRFTGQSLIEETSAGFQCSL